MEYLPPSGTSQVAPLPLRAPPGAMRMEWGPPKEQLLVVDAAGKTTTLEVDLKNDRTATLLQRLGGDVVVLHGGKLVHREGHEELTLAEAGLTNNSRIDVTHRMMGGWCECCSCSNCCLCCQCKLSFVSNNNNFFFHFFAAGQVPAVTVVMTVARIVASKIHAFLFFCLLPFSSLNNKVLRPLQLLDVQMRLLLLRGQDIQVV